MRKINKALKITILTFIIGLCAYNLWNLAAGYRSGERVKDSLQDYAPDSCGILGFTITIEEAGQPDAEILDTVPEPLLIPAPLQELPQELLYAPESVPEPEPVINGFITDLQNEINADIIAWLSIYGTKIDYPVARADDNDFYLRHNIYKNEDRAGSLFTDCRSPRNFTGFNTIIHGHNMKNRSMFGTLSSYSSPDYLEENKYGTLYTSTKTYNLEIFAYMVTSFDDSEIYANLPPGEAFYDYIRENAKPYREPEHKEKVLTLSTCCYDFEGARIVVLASLRE